MLRVGILRACVLIAASVPLQMPARAEPAPDPARVAYVASMEGRKADALAAVQQLPEQYSALVRFGLWDELIALMAPDARAPGLTAGYLYGRGVALAARGRLAEARAALADLERLGAHAPAAAGDGRVALPDFLAVAVPIVAARIAATELRSRDAVTELEKATVAEDRLPGGEGAGWFFPVRHLLGAQLLIAGRPAEAERVYREDLEHHPANGWALYGLAAALRAQDRKAAAAVAERDFAHAWEHADVRLVSSAFWFAGPDTTRCECQRQATY